MGAKLKVSDRPLRNEGNRIILNWGASALPQAWYGNTLNYPHNVSIAINKLKAIIGMRSVGVVCPEYTFEKSVAQGWLDGGSTVLVRSKLAGRGGSGITVLRREEIGDVPSNIVFVKYVRKSAEYRVHIVGGEVIDIQEKKRRVAGLNTDVEVATRSRIRSFNNGWVFVREGINPPESVVEASLLAVLGLGLDFGAVDVGWHEDTGPIVYEVNTAPGLEGSTILSYAQALRNMCYSTVEFFRSINIE